jgi:hypothetical protein
MELSEKSQVGAPEMATLASVARLFAKSKVLVASFTIRGASEEMGSSSWLYLEVGSAGDNLDASRLSRELLHGSLVVEPCVLVHDVSSLDLCLLDVVDAGVEVDDLLAHLIQFGAEAGGELLEQLLHGGGVEDHGCLKDQFGLTIPV